MSEPTDMATHVQTAALKEAFLNAFGVTGNVSRACRQTGTPRRNVYFWLQQDPGFGLAYREAELMAEDVLEQAAWERAVTGVKHEKRAYAGGALIDTLVETEYSDTLLIFLLKARNPRKYREKVTIDYADLPTDQLLAEARAIGLAPLAFDPSLPADGSGTGTPALGVGDRTTAPEAPAPAGRQRRAKPRPPGLEHAA